MKVRRGLVWMPVLFLTFFLGCIVGSGQWMSAWAAGDVYGKLDIFAKVLHYVETNYVDDVNPDDLIYGAIKGMLDELDPHTMFMPPDVYREMKIDTTGEFQGIGLVAEQRDTRLVVVKPIEGSPAFDAGIMADDIIIEINGVTTEGLSLKEAVALMRGPEGTTIRLILERPSDSQRRNVTLIRGRIRVSNVKYELMQDGIGYMKVASFQSRTAAQMVAAMKKLVVASRGKLRGLILDLRDNPGGLMSEAIRVVDEFIGSGPIVSTEGRNGNHVETEIAHPNGAYLTGRLAVLINAGSASAAEIVAGALQDTNRALVIGERSFGKGSVQNIIELEDGSGLKITVARYFTPKRRSIDGIGVKPDVQVIQPEKIARRAELVANSDDQLSLPIPEFSDDNGMNLVQALDTPSGIKEDDHQMRAAYAFLKLGKLP